jgi:ankyrin repeat protein
MNEFFTAIEAGDIAIVRRYLEQDGSAANSIDCRLTPVDPQWKERAALVGDGLTDNPPESGPLPTETALHVAARHQQTEIARLLLNHGAEVNAVNKSRMTALYFAMYALGRALNMDLLELLVERGADVNATNKKGNSMLLQLVFGWERDPLPALDLLLRHGAHVNAVDNQGRTALDCAMIYLGSPGNHVPRVELLLRYGANVNPVRKVDGDPSPPLCMVARNGNAAVARLLIEAGADVNAMDRWGTPLFHAASRGHDKIVDLLLAAGADPRVPARQIGCDSSDEFDQTPLDAVRPFEETLDHFEKVLAEL